MSISVAIIGAGASGFYTAKALFDQGVDCTVDMIEKFPSPYGLIRYGIAPDHPYTDGVIKSFEKVAANKRFEFFGNVNVGRDISLLELRSLYDVVVLAIGAPADSKPSLINDRVEGIYGAAEFVGWYTGHPEFRDLFSAIGTKGVAVIGNGNVAIDIARILGRTRAELSKTDMPGYAVDMIASSRLKNIYVLGRRGPLDAKFSGPTLRELSGLERCEPVVDPEVLPDELPDDLSPQALRTAKRNLKIFSSFTNPTNDPKMRQIHFCFNAIPMEILGKDRVEGIRIQQGVVDRGQARGLGTYRDIRCGMVIAAVGYRVIPLEGVPICANRGMVLNEDGIVSGNLVVVGWAKRGPTGLIGSNKADGEHAARQIAEKFTSGEKPGRERFKYHLSGRGVRWVSNEDWKTINAAEIAGAPAEAPRRKFISVGEMLAAASSGEDKDVGAKVPEEVS